MRYSGHLLDETIHQPAELAGLARISGRCCRHY
jgi:hypothetical protein